MIRLYETEAEAARAKRYSRARLKSMAIGTAWGAAGLALFALSGGSSALKQKLERSLPGGRFVRPAFVASALVASSLWELPASYLTGYKLERKFELTKQPVPSWLRDRVMALAVGVAFSVPAFTLANEVMRRRPKDWWLILSGASIPISVVMSNLAPILIMPLFNKFDPLDDAELVDRIEQLARDSGLQIAGVFRMDMSKQSEKANAFFTGVGNTKRIVLADTLLERYPPDEVMAVVAHEAAHQVHRDIWTLIAMGSASTLGVAWALNKVAPAVQRQTSPLTGTNRVDDIAALPVLGLLAGVIGAALLPVNAAISRFIERNADRFALEQTKNGAAYASTMVRLGRQNLADPSPSRLVTALIYSHPPIADRIARALTFDRAQGNSAVGIFPQN